MFFIEKLDEGIGWVTVGSFGVGRGRARCSNDLKANVLTEFCLRSRRDVTMDGLTVVGDIAKIQSCLCMSESRPCNDLAKKRDLN